LTTKACDEDISEFVKVRPNIYDAVDDDLEKRGTDLSLFILKKLQFTYPFTPALGRIGRIVPFLPMARGISEIDGVMHGESLTVAKVRINRQQEKLARGSLTDVTKLVSASTKTLDRKDCHQGSLIKRSLELGQVSTSTRPSATSLPGSLVSGAL
jgi:hypothetical protein